MYIDAYLLNNEQWERTEHGVYNRAERAVHSTNTTRPKQTDQMFPLLFLFSGFQLVALRGMEFPFHFLILDGDSRQ